MISCKPALIMDHYRLRLELFVGVCLVPLEFEENPSSGIGADNSFTDGQTFPPYNKTK
jgi:hypothetical protein